ncbi:terminus macrodomain insulation protein YfbV [Vibrio sinaloensis]|uniref:terminus macrodomain insulation protein YfbV n=1 Tax=Photobacterium sp. (strain ATCC 43367) TaxID=379097 RepID=UPI00057CD297|nr:terminus macrodomain insulation protein YfbV [Vibrio sinaloensis]KHT35831.1 membrane protein [Vibrio sinaloensis]
MSNKAGLVHSLRDGQKYMDAWPMRKELNMLFPEQRIIKATRFGVKVMPAIAAISVLTQMAFNNYDAMPQAVIMALFAISMPVQGMWWLGNRANTQLPPSLAGWYREIHQKIVESGFALEPMKARPRYKELAHILNRAFSQLDKSALERWF